VAVLSLGVSSVLLAILAALFARWELRRRPDLVVVALLALLVADVALFADSSAAGESGIFSLSIGGPALRLTQAAVVLALIVRLAVHGRPKDLVPSTPIWVALACWVLVAGVIGYLSGHSTNLVIRHLLVLPVIAAGMIVVGGTPAALLVRGRAFRRLLSVSATVALLLLVGSTLGLTVNVPFPLLPLPELGEVGADASTVFSTLGLVGLTVGLFSPRGGWVRLSWVLPSVVLIVSLFASSQRAARLGLAVGLLVLLLAVVSAKGRRRLSISRPEVAFAGLALAGVAATASLAVAVANPWDVQENRTSATPTFENPFGATDRQGSIESRYNQWAVGRADIAESPLIGHGLGFTARHYEVGPREVVESDLFHNIGLDVWIRTGLIGLTLAAAAVGALAIDSVRAWLHSAEDQVAALAIGGLAATGALLAKGMVESVFEKDRLAIMISVALGLMVSATLAWRRTSPAPKARQLVLPLSSELPDGRR
jgi:O-antigen ligase